MPKSTIQASVEQWISAQKFNVPLTGVYYRQVPEPPPAFPYIVFTIGTGTRDVGMEAWTATVPVTVNAVGVEKDIDLMLSEFTPGGVISTLDSLEETYNQLDGDRFACTEWRRDNVTEMTEDPLRAPDGQRVWISSGTWQMGIVVQR